MVANVNTWVIYSGTVVIYHGILTLENVGSAIIYHSISITLAPGAYVIKQFAVAIYTNLG
jgi:hypothetical protein